jgi:predicted nuclease of predicted toxin-antitoxin system
MACQRENVGAGVRLLADMHISRETVGFLQRLGHDVIRVNAVMAASAPDQTIIDYAARNDRIVLTQDLDFSALIALSGATRPSVITLRLSSSRIEHVNGVLEKLLPTVESEANVGNLITVEDRAIRCRPLPIG